ncbi:partner of Y14 and mago isoform X2 [Mercurialis annua]|uniref:partner of Y14 and mago isoform X2 n=1 Tax=Mercurialis annua TaxID=3986 RepID=UPI00215EEA3F|nr:partner of Y14 and mago isoform X2 [Mercurialis annua]
MGSSNREDDEIKKLAEISKTLKEGEKLLAPTRRPDGSFRKPIKIRAGFVPQEEVPIYLSKGALWKKEMQSQQLVPPGYDPDYDAKPKTKAERRNERKKEKRLQGKNLEASSDGDMKREELLPEETVSHASDSVKLLTTQMNELDVSANHVASAPGDTSGNSEPSVLSQDTDKRIRALKKKIRLLEAQLQKIASQDMKAEQMEKLSKLEGWQHELKLLECKHSEQAAS